MSAFPFWTWGKRAFTPPKPRTYRKKGRFATRVLQFLAWRNRMLWARAQIAAQKKGKS